MQRNFRGPRQANLGDPDVGPVLQMLSLHLRSGCEIMLYSHVQAGLTHISKCPGAVAFRSFTLAAVNDCAGAAFSGPWGPSLNPARRFLAVRLACFARLPPPGRRPKPCRTVTATSATAGLCVRPAPTQA